MKGIYLSLGSNIEPEKNIPAAIALLKDTFEVAKISSIYETDPVGPAGPEKFWNLAVEIRTSETLEKLTEKLRRIESRLGRSRGENKFAARTIDLDILPQPAYQQQAFIMVPLAEIAPAEKDPETEKSFSDLVKNLIGGTAGVRKVTNMI